MCTALLENKACCVALVACALHDVSANTYVSGTAFNIMAEMSRLPDGKLSLSHPQATAATVAYHLEQSWVAVAILSTVTACCELISTSGACRVVFMCCSQCWDLFNVPTAPSVVLATL
jgi:hypothetical protein